MRFVTPALAVMLCSAYGIACGAELVDADPAVFRFNPIVSAGLMQGGDTIATYRVRNFDDEYDVDLNAGGTLFTFVGASMLWPRRHVGLLLQGGRFISSVSGYEYQEAASLTRWPVELIGFFQWKRLRGGLGVTHHFSPKFEDESSANITLSFEDATGTVLQLDYLFERFSVGLRYVSIDYKIAANRLSGNHAGMVVTYRFGKTR